MDQLAGFLALGRVDQGQLHMTLTSSETVSTPTSPGGAEFRLAFYRDDFVLVLDATGQPTGSRSNFATPTAA